MSYTKFQLISLKRDTLTVKEMELYTPEAIITEGIPKDISRRLKYLMYFIEKAKSDAKVDCSDDVLKIFMAPEFLFRPVEGVCGSYAHADLINIMELMRNLLSDDKYKNWLFLPGTIFSRLDTDKGKDENVVFLNTVPVIEGGRDGFFSFIHKRLISTIDGAPSDKAAILNETMKPLLDTLEEMKHNIFTIKGITFALEVCLDHTSCGVAPEKGLLAYLLDKWKGAPKIDLQLLVACGMPILNVYCRKNGYVLRVDGHPRVISSNCVRNDILTKPSLPRKRGMLRIYSPKSL